MGLLDKLMGFLGLKSEFPPAGSGPVPSPAPPQGDVSFASPIEIQYSNFRGEEKTFVANRETARLKRSHVSVEVEPTGARIALKRERIVSGGEVDSLIESLDQARKSGPSPTEARVLRFHKNRGTTSPLYESLLRKYPSA